MYRDLGNHVWYGNSVANLKKWELDTRRMMEELQLPEDEQLRQCLDWPKDVKEPVGMVA